MHPSSCRVLLRWSLLPVLLGLAGCSVAERIDITGRVTRNNGSPLVGAKVTFRSPETGRSAIGYTDANGKYTLGTTTPGEGIPLGGYYVTVEEDRGPVTSMKPPTVSVKYASYADSGLKFRLTEGGATTYDMVLDPP